MTPCIAWSDQKVRTAAIGFHHGSVDLGSFSGHGGSDEPYGINWWGHPGTAAGPTTSSTRTPTSAGADGERHAAATE